MRYEPPILKFDLNDPNEAGNLAEQLSQDDRRSLAQHLIELVGIDQRSMEDWLGGAKSYLSDLERESKGPNTAEQAGSTEDADQPATELTLSAMIQFSARATDALLGEPDLAKSSEPGAEPLAAWVSSQLRTVDQAWMTDTDPLIVHMSVTGLAWRKRSFDEYDKVFRSHFLTCEEVIINANVRSVERAPRITHKFQRYPYEIDRSIARRHWVDYEPEFNENDPQAPKNFYETDLWIDFDGDEIDEPWTVVVSTDDTPEIIKIRPRWSKKTVVNTNEVLFFKPVIRFYPYRFLPDPAGNFLPKGFGWLLRRIEDSADSLLASIDDTARSSAQNGGIYGGGGFGLPDKVELKGNRLTQVPTDGQPLAQAVQLFPTKEVSQGSVAILEKMITLGDRIAGTLNTLENAPASMTATLAKGLIDSGAQVQSAVHRRMVMSMTGEFRAFVAMADAYDQLPKGLSGADAGNIAVTADPQLATEMHRSAMASVYMELLQAPLVFNPLKVGLRMLQVLRIPNPEELIATPQAPEATPKEKGEIAVKMTEAQTKRMLAIGQIVNELAQARKALVDAQAGTVDIRMALLQMAQLENAVQQMITEGASNANAVGGDGMGQQPGNGGAPQLPAPPQGSGDDALFAGAAGGSTGAGQGFDAVPPGANAAPAAGAA